MCRAQVRLAMAACAIAAMVTGCVLLAGCTAPSPVRLAAAGPSTLAPGGGGNVLPFARTRMPAPRASVLASTAADALTAAFTGMLFSSAPVVVVAPDRRAVLPAARLAALAAHAPLLLTESPVTGSPATGASATGHPATGHPATGDPATATSVRAPLLARIRSLRPRAVLAVGLAPAALAGRLPGVRVVTRAALLPMTGAPIPLNGVAVLVGSATAATPATAAVAATARVAGATVIAVDGYDPRADPKAISALAKARPREVVAIGRGFGPAARLASRVAVAVTGVQLPAGGQVLFPGHRLIALYGHPGTPGLGVLGQQDLPASITRAQQMTSLYWKLSEVPVVPAFEIIATVAQASPGPDQTYSYETPVSMLAPWVREATRAGMYVILDLQPGRASLLAQAEHYASLLAEPNVGLALDAEWKLAPHQVPLHQIGSVSIDETNSVVRWLAALTARDHLPQKLLVLHQFRLSMIAGEADLDTSQDDLAIVIHMDGQGTPAMKYSTWGGVTAAAPKHVFFGWKNFFVKDHPMLSPGETMAMKPTPVMISYQ